MLEVFETFSGIGAQAKALSRIRCPHKIVGTVDWDISAIIAYDLIHHGKPNLAPYERLSKSELLDRVSNFTLSTDGKKPASKRAIHAMSRDLLMRLCAAIDRTHNLVSITDVHGMDLPKGTNLLTYSFPCQDLSIAHAWHGKTDGIKRDANNRSSMLWQIERILMERQNDGLPLPTFLLMENVPTILSPRHQPYFEEWQTSLEGMGYYNKIYRLRSSKFGSAQDRKRIYMISILTNGNKNIEKKLAEYFVKNDLEKKRSKRKPKLQEFLRLDYTKEKYKKEAESSCPNNTESRRNIYRDNVKLYDGEKFALSVPTITTKQDRHPNSGVINFTSSRQGASHFRYLTPRECFLLMGFDEEDYENIANNNFHRNARQFFFNYARLVKLAGNSIVVNVLEAVFSQICEINRKIMSRD